MSMQAEPNTWMESLKVFSGASQALAESWVKGFREQIQTNLDTCAKLAACKDPGEIADIQERWWRDTFDRLGTGVKGCQEQLLL